MLTAAEKGLLAFDVLWNALHQPLIDGKCNRENIEENIIDGILKGELSPMNEKDVEFVCDLIDELLNEYK